MAKDKEVNKRGNEVKRDFYHYRDRYHYDVVQCSARKGWYQYDTEQDAYYFGIWVHPKRREIMTFAEGDEILVLCSTEESNQAELKHMALFYGPPPPSLISITDDKVTYCYDKDALFGREVPNG